jgi:hypothetical protein
MTSTYTDLGVELMVTGENAGTWGTKTNTNLNLIEQISGGYITQAIAGSGTTAFAKADGALDALIASRVIIFTGALTGSRIITFPVLTENFYIIKNGTSNAETLQLKAATGSGATVTWATGDKGWKIVYFDGVATNTGVYDTGFSATTGDVTLTGTQTLTNKTLTSPKIGTSILDTNGAELALLTATGSAVNEFTIANAASGNGPTLSSTGSSDSNIDINIKPKGTGETVVGTGAAAATLTTSGAHDLVLDTNSGSSSGTITITDGAAGAINIAPNGVGVAQVSGAAIKVAGLETMWVPAAAMYGPTTNPADAALVETTALRPDLKVFDFDAGTAQYTQFTVAMPKSWNLGTVTYQVFWSPSTTNTGNCIFGLQGVAIGDNDTIDIAYGTAIEVTDAGIGAVEDQQVSAVSSDMTIAGTPADDQQTYFQLYRDAADGSDTFTGESRVLGVKIFYTTDAANDA